MSTPASHRRLALSVLWAVCLPIAAARAQPVSFQLKNDVPAGQKPSLSLSAVEKVADIKLELTRDDGEKFLEAHPALEPGRTAVLPIGDGKAGKAHYTGRLAMRVAGADPWSYDLSFDTLVRAPMTVNYDFDHLDMDKHVLRFQQSRAAGKAEVEVIGEDGQEIGRGAASYDKEPAGTWLAVPWTQSGPARVLMLKLHAVAADGLAVNAQLIPWSVTIEHEDVNFDSDSAVVKPSEAGKLDASVAKIREAVRRAERFVKVKLYVAGHTDTVGSKEHNRKLSLDRARSIAEYFRRKGLTLSIAYEGFGEEVQKVPTADSVDEPRNRRADYVLGAVGASPPFAGAYRGARADWKLLK